MIFLKNNTTDMLAAFASYLTAAIAFTIPPNTVALPAAQITFHHQGSNGFWYVKMNRASGPSTTSYSRKLSPGERFTEKEMPTGAVWLLADGSVDGDLHIYAGWKQ